MPHPGTANNPGGENGTRHFGGFGPETAYGAQKRMEETIHAAPIGPTPGVNAPKRAQRRAVRGQQPQQRGFPVAPVEPGLVAAEPSYLAVWQAVAADPNASPLVRELAAQAQEGR